MRISKKWLIGALLVAGSLLSFWLTPMIVSSQTPPTYYGHVANIIAQNCLGCHTTGGIAPFSLEDPATVVRLAAGIAYVVQKNIMPPWPPGPASPPMLNERKLSPEAKETILAWVKAGAPLGDPQDRPPLPPPATPALGAPDRLITIDPPYTPNRNHADDYRCFLLDPQLKSDTFVTGYRVDPGVRPMVHHVLLFVVGAESVGAAVARDRAEDGPGWTCFGGPGVDGTGAALTGALGFWVPGTTVDLFPAGTGRLLRAGSQLIMQVHYNTAHPQAGGADATRVGLYLASEDAAMTPLVALISVAPVEIRCPGPYPQDANDPCNRNYALRHTDLGSVADNVLLFCGVRLDELLSRDIGDGSAQEMSCDRPVRQNGLALGVTGHMHLRGTVFQLELNPGTSQARVLLSIPRWDFNWQGQYWFKEPIPLRAGDKIRITCTYDNSGPVLGPDRQPMMPRYMTWGEGTTDEMCLGAVAFIASGQ
jgi:mono/diheme cytochrome c family protein